MKGIGFLLLLLALSSCGKKTTDSSDDVVAVAPGLADEIDETVSENSKFKVSVDKASYQGDEIITVTVENIGGSTLNHLGFSFEGAPSAISVSRMNCFEIIKPNERCRFAGIYKSVDEGPQEISIIYDNFGLITKETLYFNIESTVLQDDVHFLYDGVHTKYDCENTRQYQQDGILKTIGSSDYCTFRSVNYFTDDNTPIEANPLEVFYSTNTNIDEYYCPADWKVGNFSFSSSTVTEKKNFFGGTRDVVIPPGESREVCIKHGLFKCSETKVYYSRLTKVHCY